MTPTNEQIMSDVMDMYGNWVIDSKEFFRICTQVHKIDYQEVEEYFDSSKWRKNK